jgi:hypothetical protein
MACRSLAVKASPTPTKSSLSETFRQDEERRLNLSRPTVSAISLSLTQPIQQHAYLVSSLLVNNSAFTITVKGKRTLQPPIALTHHSPTLCKTFSILLSHTSPPQMTFNSLPPQLSTLHQHFKLRPCTPNRPTPRPRNARPARTRHPQLAPANTNRVSLMARTG